MNYRYHHKRKPQKTEGSTDYFSRRMHALREARSLGQLRSPYHAIHATAFTVCIIEDDNRNEIARGYAFCGAKDNFSRAKGRAIAKGRAEASQAFRIYQDKIKFQESVGGSRLAPTQFYKIGQRFDVRHEGISSGVHVLTQVGTRVYAMIGLESGNRYDAPIQIEAPSYRLSYAQVQLTVAKYGAVATPIRENN